MNVFAPDILRGKTALVAGGTSGINLEIAHILAEYGARVAVLSRSPDRVTAAIEQLQTHGNPVLGSSADVRSFEAVERVVGEVAAAWGALDIVVSGAAGNFLCAAADLSPNGFKTVVDIDLLGTFNVMRACYSRLRKPGASVINISAPQATQAYWGQIHVAAAKAGVDMLTRTLAVEWGREGVRVNAIVPGPIGDTEGMRRLAPTSGEQADRASEVPIGRYGTKREVANMALFLVSDAASYVHGAILHCDGGMVLAGGGGWEDRTRAATAAARRPAT